MAKEVELTYLTVHSWLSFLWPDKPQVIIQCTNQWLPGGDRVRTSLWCFGIALVWSKQFMDCSLNKLEPPFLILPDGVEEIKAWLSEGSCHRLCLFSKVMWLSSHADMHRTNMPSPGSIEHQDANNRFEEMSWLCYFVFYSFLQHVTLKSSKLRLSKCYWCGAATKGVTCNQLVLASDLFLTTKPFLQPRFSPSNNLGVLPRLL